VALLESVGFSVKADLAAGGNLDEMPSIDTDSESGWSSLRF
jgi:hypothetical protein